MRWGFARHYWALLFVVSLAGQSTLAKQRCEGLLQRSTHSQSDITIVIQSPFTSANGKTRAPTPAEFRDLEEMYGTKLIVDDVNEDIPDRPKEIPGTVIHMLNLHDGLKSYSGQFNLFRQGSLYRRVADQKWEEYAAVSRFDPGVMPPTWLASELIKKSPERKNFYEARRKLTASLDRFILSDATTLSESARNNVAELVSLFFSLAREAAPNGSFIKSIGERATGDGKQVIELPIVQAPDVADIFVKELERAKGEVNRNVKGFSSPALLNAFNKSERSAARLVESLVLDPDEILVQQAVKIARTRDGTKAEVRVDFTRLGPVAAHLRWGYDVAIDYRRKAFQFFKEFWERAPASIRDLSGGADVAFLEDGSMTIIEFNFGNESGFVDPAGELIPGNIFISHLLGRPTPLIARLEGLVASGEEAQILYLTGTLPAVKSDADFNHSIRDIYLPDAFQYLRDRLIEIWLRNPTAEGAQRLSSRFQAWADSQMGRLNPQMQKMVQNLALYGKQYMAEKSPTRVALNHYN